MARWLEQWAIRRAVGRSGVEGGHLLYLGRDGEVTDLGPVTGRRLVDLGWAVGVAYRYSRDRGEKGRLAAIRTWASDVARAGARVAKAEAEAK